VVRAGVKIWTTSLIESDVNGYDIVPESNPSPDIAALLERLASLEKENTQMRVENKLLREKIDTLLRKLFGASSEKIDPQQLLLLLQGLDEPGKAPEPVAAEAPRRSPDRLPPRSRGPRIPEHLPVVEEIIDPEPVKACREAWRCMGEEVTEQLDYEPARFFKRRLIRRKYVRRDQPFLAPVIAPLYTLQDRCLAAPGLLAAIIVGKYVDHVPLYRWERIFETRHQVWLPRQTMVAWMSLAADWLRPIYECIRIGVLGGGYVQVDETPIEYLCPGHGKTKLGYLWTCHAPGGDTVYHWQTSRAAACLEKIIPVDFGGVIQCDGYEAYDCFAKNRGDKIVLAGCLAHVRRKFYDAHETTPKVAGWFLQHFQNLYELEDRLRQARAGPRRRQAERAGLSRSVLARLHRALVRLKTARRYLPQSLMGKAIHHALNQWPALQLFLEDGRLEIGRVGNRRGDRRNEGVAVAGGFHHSAGASFSSVVPFPVPAPRTGRAGFPHPALISEFPAFAFDWSTRLRGSR
jgi:transposase